MLKNEASIHFILRVNSQQWLPCNIAVSCMRVGEKRPYLETFLRSGLIVCFCELRQTPICPYRLASITNPVHELSPRTTMEWTVVNENTYALNYN